MQMQRRTAPAPTGLVILDERAYGIHEDELGIQRPQVYGVPR